AQSALLQERIRCILKSAKRPPANMTKEEVKAAQTLAKDKSITILPADKGRATVIMNTEHYEKQMDTMLQDSNTYEILKKDPTEDKKKALKSLLKPLLKKEKISKETYNHLIPTASITPRIYGTPKIHKPGTPLRPIVDSIGSVTFNLSKALVDLIKPLLGLTDQHSPL
uniref:Reverse transcriptase domain-containing protein n=1 Tax=Salarias fasciatus TaxID=181472 RepID=A0A672GD92_SALFA